MQEAGRASTTPDEARERGSGESFLELAVTWCSAVLLLAVVAYLVWAGTGSAEPASFTEKVGVVRQAGGFWYLPIAVTNVGGESVRSLVVSVELRNDEDVVDSSTVTLDWLPQGSTRQAMIILDADPREHEVHVGYEGFQLP